MKYYVECKLDASLSRVVECDSSWEAVTTVAAAYFERYRSETTCAVTAWTLQSFAECLCTMDRQIKFTSAKVVTK